MLYYLPFYLLVYTPPQSIHFSVLSSISTIFRLEHSMHWRGSFGSSIFDLLFILRISPDNKKNKNKFIGLFFS